MTKGVLLMLTWVGLIALAYGIVLIKQGPRVDEAVPPTVRSAAAEQILGAADDAAPAAVQTAALTPPQEVEIAQPSGETQFDPALDEAPTEPVQTPP